MDFSQFVQRYAVVKLYPGLDETIFQRLLNDLGMDVVFTNDPSDYYQIRREETICANSGEQNSDCFVEDAQLNSQVDVKHLIDEWTPLHEIIEVKVDNVDSNASDEISNSHEVTVQCEVGEPITLSTDEVNGQTLTCFLCQEEVPEDKKSLKSHVKTHSGKRYGCRRCKYHTDRKFDFTRHLRRRHEGEPEPPEDNARPHWTSMFHLCFPSYRDVAKYRRTKITTGRSKKCNKPHDDDRSFAVVPTTDCPTTTVVC